MGHRTLKLSRLKDRPTQAAHVSRPVIHTNAHTRANNFRVGVRRTSLDLQEEPVGPGMGGGECVK
jgi:hypothetical protein